MDNFKEILIFLGFSLNSFVINIGINIGLLVLSLIVVFPLFFLSFYLFNTIYLFLILMFLFLVFIHQWRKKFLLKRQCQMNSDYWSFLETGIVAKNGLKTDWNVILIQTNGQLKKKGMVVHIKKVVSALSVAVSRRKAVGKFIDSNHPLLRNIIIRSNVMEFTFFLLLLIPFTVISYFLTASLSGSIQILIHVVGFLFVYFLHSGVFDPIFYLLVQRDVYEEFKSS